MWDGRVLTFGLIVRNFEKEDVDFERHQQETKSGMSYIGMGI
jgi:hypothetical protein